MLFFLNLLLIKKYWTTK